MKGKEILVSHNPLWRQYKKKQAIAEVYRLYARTHERRGEAEEEKRIRILMETNSRNIIIYLLLVRKYIIYTIRKENFTSKKDYWGKLISTST